MAEFIKREAVIDLITRRYENPKICTQEINSIPAADVVEVVRCKDCKYCIKEDDYEFWCNGFCSPARLVNPEDFCSHGFNKSELCCCLNGTSEEAEAAIERVKARIGRVNNG